MKLLKLSLLLILIGLHSHSYAKLIQIIHTNDLHSYFAGTRSGDGGYARIKTLIDKLKSDAAAKGIQTIYLDGGDFGEGSTYHMSNKGVDSLRALDLLGVDVTVLGNHDHMLGGDELEKQIEAAEFKGQVLSANLRGKNLMGLKGLVKNYTDIKVDGLVIRVMGLSTSELHFQYPLIPKNFIRSPLKKAKRLEKEFTKDRFDFLIALTHIGLEKDEEMVAQSKIIDLVIGGHSHTRLDQPKMVLNSFGKLIPIVQTGAHGLAVGSVILDITNRNDYKLIDYRLYNVTPAIPEDSTLKTFIEEAFVNREKYFNRKWDEVIGFSDITFTGYFDGNVRNTKSCWSRHLARMTRQVADADIGIQFDFLQGEEISKGPITFGDIIDNFPHFKSWGDNGMNVYNSRISGIVLKKLLKSFSDPETRLDVVVDGLTVEEDSSMIAYEADGTHDERTLFINGQEIMDYWFYEVAMPSAVPVALKILGPVRNLLIRGLIPVPNSSYWVMVEDYVRNNSPITCAQN